MKTLLSAIFVVLVFGGCSPAIYSSTESKARLASHKTIAILPFEVRFDLRNNNRKQFTDKDLAEVSHFMATGLQEHLYHWLISYGRKKAFSVEIQNIEITDSILEEKQIRFMDLYNLNRIELAKMLHVDAVLTSNVIFAQPNSEAAAVALTTLPGQNLFFNQLATQEMKMQVLLNDTISQNSIWEYETKTQNSNYTEKSKDRKKENILYPLFQNIDKTLVKVIKRFPYRT
jgi:hypothetical protein